MELMNEPKQWLGDALKNKVWLPKFFQSWIFSVKLIDIVMHKWIINWPISWHLTFQETTKPFTELYLIQWGLQH